MKNLGIKAGDHRRAEIRDEVLALVREPIDFVAAMRGLGAEIWQGVDVEKFIRRERDSWDENPSWQIFSTLPQHPDP